MPRGRRNDFHLKGTEVLQNRAVILSGALKDKQASNMQQCGKCSRKDRNKVMQEVKETGMFRRIGLGYYLVVVKR